MNHQKDKAIIYWLASGCLLVFLMVIIGGITRLTGSGLSITEWKVVTGTFPPLNEAQWQTEFEKYKLIPQYQLINSHFTLSDFKAIYFWEYIHRLIGRMIGIVFIIPFIWFYVKKRIRKELIPRLLVMFLLGALQGFIGWYMVSSGLSENTRVSHLRLALHLGTAFITFGYIFYVLLEESFTIDTKINQQQQSTIPAVILLLIFIQIIFGAFVAGTHAGYVYNTWPKMEGEWIPESISFALEKTGMSSLINNLASVQFIHRGLAYLIFAAILGWWLMIKNNEHYTKRQQKAANMLFQVTIVQVAFGIFTLLSKVPVWMGVVHQSLAFVLFASAIYQCFLFRKTILQA